MKLYHVTKFSPYFPGQKSLGQSEHNCNSMCVTSSVVKSSAVILQIVVPSPFPTQYNVERSVGKGWGRAVLVARGYNFACVQKHFELYNCPNTFVQDCRTAFHDSIIDSGHERVIQA